METLEASIVVPVRNEGPYLQACLQSLLQQTYPLNAYEVIVVDGRSSDDSRNIVAEIQKQHSNVRLLDNPAAIAAAAMNRGIGNAGGKVIIRADAHSIYPPNYVADCLRHLKETGASNVGGPWLTVPADNSFGARMVAAVLSSPFGVGNSKFRTTCGAGFVETVPFGAFRKELFDQVGLYNEKLVCNEDNDLNARIRRGGGKIYQAPELRTTYHAVAGFGQLLRKTFKTSQWHIFSLRESRFCINVRHLVPAALVLVMSALLGVCLVSSLAAGVFVSLLIGYLLAGYGFALSNSRRYRLGLTLAFPFACLGFHLIYGMGTIAGLRYLFTSPAPQPIRAGQRVQTG